MNHILVTIFSLIILNSEIICANNSLVNTHLTMTEQCFLFKYSSQTNTVLKATGLYADYTQFVIENIDEKNQIENVFYEFLEVYEKKNQTLTCDKIGSLCMIKTVPRKTNMNQKCYKTTGKLY